MTDLIPEHVAWADAVYACGPNVMFRTMAKLGITRPTQVLIEARMGCGLGACYACSVPTTNGYLRVCTYGPKYDLNELVAERL